VSSQTLIVGRVNITNYSLSILRYVMQIDKIRKLNFMLLSIEADISNQEALYVCLL